MSIHPSKLTVLFCGLLIGFPVLTFADDPDAAQLEEARATAVALNYCRASFHRIRKSPTPETLTEEREKILNNLNLSRLEDPEVVALYTSVLDEINQMGVSDREHVMYKRHHASSIRRQLTWDAFAFGTDLATANFGSAIRTGANSWWDYRNKAFQRDMDLFKIEKTRMNAVMQRSSQFLDTFWKLAQKKEIPDRWLVRGDDLDHLESAMSEKDAEVRLRILKRMEPFMEAYPPYWYYVARTKQELGDLTDAIAMYGQLTTIGNGHFRKDDMLATALANRAAIEDYLGRATAVASAQRALDYSTDVWEANLIAARVLQRHGQFVDAEDAILRNLDVELEQHQSTVFLASLYYFSEDEQKLAKLLNDQQAVAHLPAPVLLRCAATVGIEHVPPHVMRSVLASLEARPQMAFGPDQLVVRVGHAWQLHLAKISLSQDGRTLADPSVIVGRGYHDLRFAGPFDWGSPLKSQPEPLKLAMALTYPDETVIRLTLTNPSATSPERGGLRITPASLRIADVRVAGKTIALRPQEAQRTLEGPVHVEVSRPVIDPDAIPLPPPEPEPVSDQRI